MKQVTEHESYVRHSAYKQWGSHGFPSQITMLLLQTSS